MGLKQIRFGTEQAILNYGKIKFMKRTLITALIVLIAFVSCTKYASKKPNPGLPVYPDPVTGMQIGVKVGDTLTVSEFLSGISYPIMKLDSNDSGILINKPGKVSFHKHLFMDSGYCFDIGTSPLEFSSGKGIRCILLDSVKPK